LLALGEAPDMTSYNRYSHHVRRALTHASQLVRRYQHPYVDTGHLLVGVLLTEGSIGCKILQAMDLSADQAEPQLQALYIAVNLAESVTDKAYEMTLQLAADEAVWLSHHYIGTEHLLLGITRVNAGHASALLRQMGTSSEHLRYRVRRALTEGATELDLQSARQMARFSELSRRVINAAEQLSLSLNHDRVGIGHLIVVLAQETRSPTAHLLRDSGLDMARLQADLGQNNRLLLTGIEGVLNQMLDLVERIGSHYTGTEHLLLTLATDPAAQAVLAYYGVQVEHLQQRL
jgi:ATP-dependent Clp protease ATP-binding subunit ClpA